jgi:hypothetical protein
VTEPPDDYLLTITARYAGFFEQNRITADELAGKVLDCCAAEATDPTRLAPQIIALIPPGAMAAFRARVAEVLRPDYRKAAWHRGGGRPQTDEEMAGESAVLTARLKAWAEEFRS